MPRSKKATPSVSFSVLSKASGITLTVGTQRDVPTLGFDPQEPTFVVGGIIKYVLMLAAGSPIWVKWLLERKERAASPSDMTSATVLRDLWEDKHLLASGIMLVPLIGTPQGSPGTGGKLMIPIRKTTLRDDEELGLSLQTMTTDTDFEEFGVTKVMHKRV